MHDQRQIELENWLKQVLTSQPVLIKLADDASFRRYFRVKTNEQTLVAMDAPPDKEDSRPFVAIAQAFAKHGVKVPEILAVDLAQGFLLLSDLGDQLYLNELTSDNVNHLYQQALSVIPLIQACQNVSGWELPHFGTELIQRELELFRHWFLQIHLALELDAKSQTMLTNTFAKLIHVANEQPQVCVHRDYHSRNLLRLTNDEVGVIDFQDAVWGPVTYDAVSLLRDCYIVWPQSEVKRWLLQFYQQCCDHNLIKNVSEQQFLYWFDLVGVQRHLKVLGIFSRLYHRDGKKGYLNDMPRILDYLLAVTSQHSELNELCCFLQSTVQPKLREASVSF